MRKVIFNAPLLATFFLVLGGSGPAFAQASHSAFHATHYDVQATLRPADQSIVAHATVDFVADSAGREINVELHPDLKVNSVKNQKGQDVSFDRDSTNGMLVHINLTDAVATGQQVTLTFDYGGPVTNDDDSPTKDVRFSWVDKNSAYLLLPARWFPLTNFPSNRYTATFKIIVPDNFAVAGTGKADTPTPLSGTDPGVGKEVMYTFHCDHPAPSGTFVAGDLQLNPVSVEGIQTNVYAPPAAAKTATAYATELAHIVSFYSDEFGSLQDPNITIAQMPDGSLQGFAGPGLLLVSARMWTPKPNTGLLAQLAATQWWGDAVLPASLADTWVTDGLASYSQALYQEQDEGNLGLHNALDQFAVGAVMFEGQIPIAQAERLGYDSDQYASVVEDKGAMVFNMLRAELGNKVFDPLLHDFFAQYNGKTASVAQFEQLAQSKAPPEGDGLPPINLTPFFSQWVDSTGIPQFKLTYIVYRTKQGFKVVGKITQDLETFQMPVELKVETEGNPETKMVDVVGTTSAFEVDTFGRPKPNGITLDPNNNILKSTPQLQIRATVARGETLAANGEYYEAIQQYQKALDIQPNNSLAHFRTGEAMFFQKNYQSAANSFRSALDGNLDPKWTEVWSHIYLGKIFDVTGQRDRAVNEYQRAQQLRDNTAGAQAEAARYLQKPFSNQPAQPAAPATTAQKSS